MYRIRHYLTYQSIKKHLIFNLNSVIQRLNFFQLHTNCSKFEIEMAQKIIDLRSDTVTKPSKEMLEAMMNAPLGDDVFNEDPTVNALQEKAAKLFGMEDAIFCSSGTQTNQIAIKVHTQPGDEVICDALSHIYLYEGGGIAFNSGASVRLLHGDYGRFTADDVIKNINDDNVHFPASKMVSIENTVNKGGGVCWDIESLKSIKQACQQHNLILHLDGARLFNALIAKGESPLQYGQIFDTISICLSKGLGAPVGSLLLGKKEHIYKARRIRKVMGGGMRQAGILAAAGIYALDNHVDRLQDDHDKAKLIASALKNLNWVELIYPVETNIVIFKLNEQMDAKQFIQKLDAAGFKATTMGNQLVRFVCHLDQDMSDIERLAEVLKKLR